jgi:hypothetical protein
MKRFICPNCNSDDLILRKGFTLPNECSANWIIWLVCYGCSYEGCFFTRTYADEDLFFNDLGTGCSDKLEALNFYPERNIYGEIVRYGKHCNIEKPVIWILKKPLCQITATTEDERYVEILGGCKHEVEYHDFARGLTPHVIKEEIEHHWFPGSKYATPRIVSIKKEMQKFHENLVVDFKEIKENEKT